MLMPELLTRAQNHKSGPGLAPTLFGGGLNLPTLFHIGSKMSNQEDPCSISTLVLSLTCPGAAGITQKHSPSSPHLIRERLTTSQEQLTQIPLAEKVAGNGGRTHSQERPFPRIPALFISNLLHSRSLCALAVTAREQFLPPISH